MLFFLFHILRLRVSTRNLQYFQHIDGFYGRKKVVIYSHTVILANCMYSQCITSFQNPKFLLKKPMDLGIGAYKLFLNFLFQRTRIDPQFSKSKPTYHLIFALLRIIQVIILLTRCHQGMIFTERYLNNHYKE